MNIWQSFVNFFRKESQARTALSFNQVGQPVQTPQNYEAMSREGYQKNVVVYRCVSMIARSASGIRWDVFTKRNGKVGSILENHPILDLMARPNPLQSGASFIEAAIAYLTLSGNSYIEAAKPSENAPPMELWTVRPDMMRIVPNAQGYVGAYVLKTTSSERTWGVNPIDFSSDIMHVKYFHPTDLWYGLSPLQSALLQVDQANAGNKWNLALLQNSAVPSGVLQVKTSDSNPTGALSEIEYQRLRDSFSEQYQGARNAGRPMLLEGGVDWKTIALSPKDMEFIQARTTTAEDISLAFGVPAEMLGFGEKTFANYQEARESFYEETILPTMDLLQGELNRWLVPMFGDQVMLAYDKDDIEALQLKRERRFASFNSANYLTFNEKREALGYDPVEGGNVFAMGSAVAESPADLGSSGFGGFGAPAKDDEPEMSDEPVTPNESDIEEDEDKSFMQIKFINPINGNDRMNTWRQANRRRKRLEASFRNELKLELDNMAESLARVSSGKEPRLAEFAILQQIDKSMVSVGETIEKHIRITVKDFGQALFNQAKSLGLYKESKERTRQFVGFVESFVKRRTANAVSEISGTTAKKARSIIREAVNTGIDEGQTIIDISDSLRSSLKTLSTSRADLIARTEVSMASNNSVLEAARELELPGMVKEWVSLQDTRTRDGGKTGLDANHLVMNGVEIPIDNKFSVPPDGDMEGPGDPSAGASQLCNCRCVLMFRSRE